MKKALVFILVLFCVGGCTASLPQEKVTIYRDIYGVPHIVAESDEGAFFGAGYAQTQDHLEQMMKNFAQATGRLASIDEPAYESDVIVTMLGIPEVAQKKYDNLSFDTQRAIEAFCKGINTYIKEKRRSLPAWIQEVEPEEVVALSKYVMLSRPIGYLKKNELRHIKGKSILELGIHEDMSNEWVVSGKKTASGNVMLQADPHLPWGDLNQWYEIHIKGETINVAGATLFGLPAVIMGFNEKVAWAMTANSPDTVDVYEEKIKIEGNNYYYLYNNQWKEIEEKKVKIETTKGKKEVTFYYTHHGPVIAFDEERQVAYSAKLSTQDQASMIEQTLLMNRASNLEEFKNALSMQQFVRWNIVYGDVSGNIYYVYNTRVGIRSEEYDWTRPVPGWISDTEWKGVYPFEELPQAVNPEEGFFQNCNVAPWFINRDSGIQKVYPHYLVPDNPMGERGERATHLLSQEDLFTVEDMMSFSLDTYSLFAEENIQPLVEMDESSLDDTTKEALTLLKGWDLTVEKENREPLLFLTWYKMKDSPDSLKEAVDFLTKTYGRFDVLWGDIHVIKRGDTYPLSGSSSLHTLFMTGGEMQGEREYCDHGSSYLLLVELGTPVKAWSLRPFGQSEDINSPHYADMTALYSKKQYKQFFFTEADILQNFESKVILEFS